MSASQLMPDIPLLGDAAGTERVQIATATLAAAALLASPAYAGVQLAQPALKKVRTTQQRCMAAQHAATAAIAAHCVCQETLAAGKLAVVAGRMHSVLR